MADATFPLELVTPDGGVKTLTCECLTVTLCDGEAAFLRGHTPFLGALPAGIVKVRVGETVDRYEIGEAFLQVSPAAAAIFSDKCEKLE